MSLKNKLKSYFRQKVGFRKFLHKIRIRSWGTWLYKKNVVQWITYKNYRSQLPILYQIFATYCALWIKIIRIEEIIGSRPLLYTLIRLQRWISHKNSILLNLSGTHIFLNLEDPRFLGVGNEIVSGDISNLLSFFIKEGDTFVDVGANQGSYSIIASNIVGESGIVISIEPQPQLAQNILKSLDIYAKCRYQVHQIAVGETNGSIELIVPKSSSGTAGIYEDHSGLDKNQRITVPLKCFDELIEWKNFSGTVFIKLDIEGAEFAFMKGAKKMLATLDPILMMEINPMSLQVSETSFKELIGVLYSFGFTHYRHTNDYKTFYKLLDLKPDTHQNVLLSK